MENDARWDRMWSIFHDARALEPDERDAFVQGACQGDRDLFERVRRLLEAHEQPGAFLEEPALTSSLVPHNGHSDLSGRRIGHYTLRRRIAAGGMGVVYEAVQESPHRSVALKLMRSGIASRSALRRFEFESQLLARLRHAGIAQVYEAGTHDDGTGAVPFFAMEYIPSARTIIEYATFKEMGTRLRLELFGQVCDAVHHAHQKGIIHRDLKPSNILVDSSGTAKVIDFGVARATDSDMAITTLQTDVGQLIGTLQYMSPEQCQGDPNDLDTRSDVYALGVIAYELLCGKPPFRLTGMPIPEAAKLIQTERPVRPSQIDRTLRGDLETIVLKALDKDRDRRYQSAADLGQDIARYLGDEPIEARPPSLTYQLRMLARRNRGLFTSAATVLVFLVAGLVTGWLGRNAAVRAEEDTKRSEAETTAMMNILVAKLVNPDESDASLQAVVERAGIRPTTASRMRLALATAYSARGRYEKAVEEALVAMGILNASGADEPALEFAIAQSLVEMHAQAGHAGEAWEIARDLVLPHIGEIEMTPEERVFMRARMATVMPAEQSDKAIADLQEAAAFFSRKPNLTVAERDQYAWILNRLGSRLGSVDRFDEAVASFQKGIEVSDPLLPDVHAWASGSRQNLGTLLMRRARTDNRPELLPEAERFLRESLKLKIDAGDADYVETLATQHNLARAIFRRAELDHSAERLQEAESLWRQTLARAEATNQQQGYRYAMFCEGLGELLLHKNEIDEAEQLALRAVTMMRSLPDQTEYVRRCEKLLDDLAKARDR